MAPYFTEVYGNAASRSHEYGAAQLEVLEARGPTAPFEAGSTEPVWMSHGDHVTALPEGFTTVGRSKGCAHAAIVDPGRRMWGVQFHPEVTHTPRGSEVLGGFLDLCGFARDWSMARFVEEAVERIRARKVKGKLILDPRL